MSTYDEILRLSGLAFPMTSGPLPPAPPAVGAGQAPPAPPPQATQGYQPGMAAPGDIHALSSQVLGHPGIFERIARVGASAPLLSPVTSLLDLAGAVTGHSGIHAMNERRGLDKLQQHLDDQARIQAAEDRRSNLAQRASAIASRLSDVNQRHDALVAQKETLRASGDLSKASEDELNARINDYRQRGADLSAAQARILSDPAFAVPGGMAEASTPGLPATPYDAIRKEATARAQGAASVKPVDTTDPGDYVDTVKYGRPVMDISDVVDQKTKKVLIDRAKKLKLPIVDKAAAASLERIGAASNNLADLLRSANQFLPDQLLSGPDMAREWYGQIGDKNIKAYNAFRSSAIPLVQAAASLGTGNRITTVELNTILDSAFPTLPRVEFGMHGIIPSVSFEPGDSKASAAQKGEIIMGMLENARAALLGDATAQDRLVAAIKQLRDGAPAAPPKAPTAPPSAPPSSRPGGRDFDPAARGSKLADPNFDPAARGTKVGSTVRQHTRSLRDSTRTP